MTSAREGRLPLDELVTVGISCESCHLGGREHAELEVEMPFGPVHPRLRAVDAAAWLDEGRDSAQLWDALCGPCPCGPSPRYPLGGAQRNSGEAFDLAASACAPVVACTDCHDPHVRGTRTSERKRRLAACAGCHPSLASSRSALAHGRHKLEDATCLDCHMPRIVQGFSDVIRTHRIGRALEPSMVAAGQPNACNLCHLDRSVAWAAQQVSVYWGRDVDVPEGGGDHAAGRQWLASDDPLLMVTAAAAYARSSLGKGVASTLVDLLDQPIAYYRMRVLFALEEVLGRELSAEEFDPAANPAVRRDQQLRLRSVVSRPDR